MNALRKKEAKKVLFFSMWSFSMHVTGRMRNTSPMQNAVLETLSVSLVPRPHPLNGGKGSGGYRAISWLC